MKGGVTFPSPEIRSPPDSKPELAKWWPRPLALVEANRCRVVMGGTREAVKENLRPFCSASSSLGTGWDSFRTRRGDQPRAERQAGQDLELLRTVCSTQSQALSVVAIARGPNSIVNFSIDIGVTQSNTMTFVLERFRRRDIASSGAHEHFPPA